MKHRDTEGTEREAGRVRYRSQFVLVLSGAVLVLDAFRLPVR